MTHRPAGRRPAPLTRVGPIARGLSLAAFLLGVFGLLAAPALAAGPRVALLPTSGIVDQVMAGYLRDGVAAAGERGAAAVIVQLDTPGGSLESTNQIVGTFLEAPLPVIVWVSPSGGRAASAGTFMTLAGHIALMAPGTNIGAASPVGGQGEDIAGTMGEKVLNDAVAKITAIARERGRNVEWAVATVREARSSDADEAVALGAVDGKAATIAEVLAFAQGRTVSVRGAPVTLDLAGATVETLEMNPFQSFLHLLSDPNIAFILFTLGFYGLLFELQNPNFVTGIGGALALILAFIGFGSLPLNVGGLILIGLAIVLFVLEFTVASHGLLTIGGIVCFALGASALYGAPGTPAAPSVEVALPVVIAVTAMTGGFMAFVVFVVVRSRREAARLGPAGAAAILPVDSVGEVRADLHPVGSVYAAGEEWSAASADGHPVRRGTPVRVLRQEGLTLIVEPLRPEPADAGRSPPETRVGGTALTPPS